jgi:hypothetical protein
MAIEGIYRSCGPTANKRFSRSPSESLPLECLWGICNSPLANAFAFAQGTKRHTTAGVLRSLPVPEISIEEVDRLRTVVRAYLATACEFTQKIQIRPRKAKLNSRAAKAKTSEESQLPLTFGDEPTEAEIARARERLRALHWRVDAEVLKLYRLPVELERELLDSFDGVRRVGVPFEQTQYIPRHFQDALALDEFLRITDEWDVTERRRCELVEKRARTGGRTADEEREFRQLQRLLMLRRRYCSPLPTTHIRAATQRLKKERQWEENR